MLKITACAAVALTLAALPATSGQMDDACAAFSELGRVSIEALHGGADKSDVRAVVIDQMRGSNPHLIDAALTVVDTADEWSGSTEAFEAIVRGTCLQAMD